MDLQVGASSKFSVDPNGLHLGLLGLKSYHNKQLDMNHASTIITSTGSLQAVNNWAMGGLDEASFFMVTHDSNGDVEVTGIAGGTHGKVVIFWLYQSPNSFALRLMNADTRSTSGNRLFHMHTNGGAHFSLKSTTATGDTQRAIAYVYVDSAVVTSSISGWYELWRNTYATGL